MTVEAYRRRYPTDRVVYDPEEGAWISAEALAQQHFATTQRANQQRGSVDPSHLSERLWRQRRAQDFHAAVEMTRSPGAGAAQRAQWLAAALAAVGDRLAQAGLAANERDALEVKVNAAWHAVAALGTQRFLRIALIDAINQAATLPAAQRPPGASVVDCAVWYFRAAYPTEAQRLDLARLANAIELWRASAVGRPRKGEVARWTAIRTLLVASRLPGASPNTLRTEWSKHLARRHAAQSAGGPQGSKV